MADLIVTVPSGTLTLPADVIVPAARIPDLPAGAVASVNGETGVVVLDAADVGAATAAQGGLADSAVQPGDLGNAASLDVGTTAGTVAAGDHTHAGYAAASHEHTAADIDSGAATDGHVLTADGAGGAAWEAPTGGSGGGVAPAVPTGAYIAPPGYPMVARDVGVALSAGTAKYFPMRLDAPWTLTEVAISVAALASGSVVHVALYADPTASVQPGGSRLALPSGAGFDSSSTGTKQATGLSLTLSAGNYVWVVVAQSGNPTLLGYRIATGFLTTTVQNQWADRLERAGATMPPPDPGESWSGLGSAAAAFPGVLWLKGEA